MPFVLINCSVADEPYALTTDVSAAESDDLLKECQRMEYLVAECIDVLQQEAERIAAELAQVEAAAGELAAFDECKTAGDLTMAPDSSESGASCEGIIADVLGVNDICLTLSDSDKYADCDDIEDAVDEASLQCAKGSIKVSDSFCKSLN